MFYFPHIPKAGGETLKQLFYQSFGKDRCLKIWNPMFGADFSADQIEMLNDVNYDKYDAIIGHFTVEQFLSVDPLNELYRQGKVNIMTSIRDPIDRIISLYNYMSVNTRHPNHKDMLDRDPFDFILSQKANFQFDYLCEMKSGEKGLAQGLDIFAMADSVERFKSKLEMFMGTKLKVPKLRNQTSDFNKDFNFFSKFQLAQEQLVLLKDKHSTDYKLLINSKVGVTHVSQS